MFKLIVAVGKKELKLICPAFIYSAIKMVARKVLRPARCLVLACTVCIEDIELEKEVKEVEIGRRYPSGAARFEVRTAMNENHDLFIQKFPSEIVSHIFIQYSPPVDSSTDIVGLPRYISVRYARNGGSWRGQHQSFELGSALAALRLGNITIIYHDEVINILNEHSARWHDMGFDLSARLLHCLTGSSQ
jgi:hypothetical protein